MEKREVVCHYQDDSKSRQSERPRSVSTYLRSLLYTPVYNQSLGWCEFENTARIIKEGWAEHDRTKTTGALSDQLIDEIVTVRNREECQAKVRKIALVDIDTHIPRLRITGSQSSARNTPGLYRGEFLLLTSI